jgi:CheY-like chemotaxis protein
VRHERVLIVDDDVETTSSLSTALAKAGVEATCVGDAFAAIDELREQSYRAVVLDPIIRRGMNGYAVLDFVETEQPEMLAHLFLLTGMSEQTIRRTAPAVLERLYRKSSGYAPVVAAVVAECAKQNEAWNRSDKWILLLEDDNETAALTIVLLQEHGYSVEWVRNGREALSALPLRDFDLIMVDLVLPEMDGFMFLDDVRARLEGILDRVVVVTGMPDKYLQSLPVSEIAGIVRKPLDFKELERLLRKSEVRRTRRLS